ncbi:MAG: penicillin-binding protein 2 [Cutibacterium avidum]|uniref:peptidoglycan D,D-transpeptidase FtsI family protein n=1 Tax=Cutibacterium avidum TaxID=33010 RepID=UPI0022E8E077|nr:penicillin-binding protein 2 [Cutibacterium avidum]MBS5745116.1 penicillin-binding protein 2 [Propionibacterium sp.]MDK7359238.1 penicillin-binding protein 2 [Cutibacterium avidum]MDK7373110.1 penicillin-binding protein 2 [Cutibacterium avidum]MDU3725549.1 penicillin-binding protein 2 [Cutibacterium avidum]MDU3748477.1 penicillin-binding protein 2 [Cutibacterium avidum]
MASQRGRLTIIMAAFLVLAIGLASRALQLQAIEAPAYAASAAARMKYTYDLQPDRGRLTDRNGTVMAQTQPAVLVFVDPRMISRNGVDERVTMSRTQREKAAAAPKAIAKILAKHLGGRPEDYRKALTATDSKGNLSRYSVVRHHVDSYTFDLIKKDMKEGEWYGIFSSNDPIRTYPSGKVASNVVGFVNAEGKGAGGFEHSHDKALAGVPGKESYEASTWGRIPLGSNTLVPAVNGTSYALTLDAQLQLMAQQALGTAIKNAKAKSGEIIMMDVTNGEVLAMVSMPTFDSNKPGKAKESQTRNRTIQDAYEPGSVQKVLTMAALTDQGVLTPDTHIVVPPALSSGGGKITDAEPHGTEHLTARGVFVHSSNIGTTLFARNLDKGTMASYLKSFGLGAPTGIGLPGEAHGQIPKPDMPDYTRDQVAFGQGLSVTAIQEAAAVAGIVNGGVYHSPTIIKSAVDGHGEPAEIPDTTTRRVISQQASEQVRDMMENVVSTAKGRPIPDYRMGGKTGTAQRVDPQCHCYRGYISSFIAVAPIEKPRILTYVVINQPTNGHTGTEVAQPAARQLMSVALPRYGVQPSTDKTRKEPLEYQP